MSRRRLFGCVLFSVFLAVLAWSPIRSSSPQGSSADSGLVAGRNVNMVAGTVLPGGDPWLQRQNEPSIAVSTRNPLHLLAGANDYRTVDMAASEGELPGIPGLSAGDAWLGVYFSVDGGQSWASTLVRGYPQDLGSTSPLKAYSAAADPTVRAGTNGLFYYTGLAFNRAANTPSVVFLSRYIDNDNVEGGQPFKYLDTNIVAAGNALAFLDKPWVAVDIPRNGSSVIIDGQTIPAAPVYIAYTVFYGAGTAAVTSELRFLYSLDCGQTWSSSVTLDKTTTKDKSQVQGASIAVSPKDGTVYVAWRKFDKNTKKGSIYCATSTNFGAGFGAPDEVAKIKPFDQGASTVSFRTNGYPAMTVDNDGIVYVAWSERVQGTNGPGRIMVATYGGGKKWSKNQEVDPSGQGHQFMPSIACAGGKILVAWYDQRNDASGAFTEYIDEVNPIRHTVDVFMAEAAPGNNPVFKSSVQVSRYLWALKDLGGGNYVPRQVQYNPPNYKLFKGGTTPFHGDYVDIAPAPPFLLDNGSWRYNTRPMDVPLFHIAWTDNRDVRPPQDNDWTNYTPPTSIQPFGSALGSCDPMRTGMRNQNIYTAAVVPAAAFGALGNNKPMTALGTNPKTGDPIRRAFAVFARNTTGQNLVFRFSVAKEPKFGDASFLEFGSLDTLDVAVGAFSSVSRPVFVWSTLAKDTATIDISQVDALGGSPVPGGLHGSVVLNPDATAPDVEGDLATTETHTPNLENPDLVNWGPGTFNPLNPDLINPNLENPDLINYDIVNPNLENLDLVTPNLVTPDLINPNLENKNFINPNLENPNLENTSLADAQVTDVRWKVTNAGNTVTSYSFKTFSKEAVPAGIYLQLLIYRVHYTPGVSKTECALKQERHDELLANIINPNLIDPNRVNPNLENPNLENPNLENATFSLAPGDEASVILRIVNPTPSMAKRVAGGRAFDPQSFAESVGAATTSQAVDTQAEAQGTTVPAAAATKLVIGTAALPDAPVGTYYQTTLNAYGGTPPYYWSLNSGELPADLALDSGTGIISGMPTAAGTKTFTIQVEDAAGQTDTQRYSIYAYSGTPDPLTIVTTSLPSGVQGTVYGATLVATGGVYPRAWTLDSGTLPPGLSLDSGGVISGIPSATGTYNFTVRVTDNASPNKATTIRALSIAIGAFTGDVTISGTIYDSTHFPLKDVLLRGLPGAPTTGDDGAYIATVPIGWSGTVIPFKVGYTFSPASRTYTNLSASMSGEDYNSTETLVSEEWVSRYSGPASVSEDTARAMAMDSAGNIFITGNSDQGSTRYDYITAKYDKSGNKLAEARYAGPYYMDWPLAITVDASDNVYVTGFSYGLNPNLVLDTVTIKYDNGLHQLAIARHSEPSGDVEPVSITTDASGNVYIAAVSYAGTTTPTNDFVTIKYDSTLNEQWARTYSVSPTSEDDPFGIAADASGGVYVTGTTIESGGAEDIVTIKYDASGTFRWADIFNGSGNSSDSPVGIKVNSAGDIYLAGATYSSASMNDYLIRKYRADGTILWTRVHSYSSTSYDNAVAMAVDSADNIYVSGTGSGGPAGTRTETVKFDPLGNPVWTSWQAYPTMISSMTVDSSSQVYLAGYGVFPPSTFREYVALKLTSTGGLAWTSHYDPGSRGSVTVGQVGVDGSGNVFLSGTALASATGNDFYAVMFNSSGVWQWDQRYDGPPNNDTFVGMAMDPSGNIVTLGTSNGSTTYADFVTTKYNSAGGVIWTKRYDRYDGVSHYQDIANSLAVDAAGHVYVAGASEGLLTILKYDAVDGHEIWATPATHAGTLTRNSAHLAFDSAGNVYVAGSKSGSGGSDFLLLQINPATGAITGDWTYDSVVGGTSGYDTCIAMAIDSVDNIYLTGQSRVSPSFYYDIMTVKFDIAGGTHGEARYDGPGHVSDSPIGIKTDYLNNVIVLGNSPGAGYDSDMVTIKYSSSLTQVWADRYDDAAHGSDQALGLAVDATGNIYITGGSSESSSSGMQDYITIKYDPSGTRTWEHLYDSGYMINDTAEDIGLDDLGNVYITGMSQAAEGSSDFATLKYDSAGHLLWVIRYNGPGHSSDYGYALRIGPASANYPVYVVGSSEGAGTEGMSIALIKYKQK